MRTKRVFLFFCIFLVSVLVTGGLWTEHTEHRAHVGPREPWQDLGAILEKHELSDEDVALLWQQTGLREAGIRSLWSEGEQQKLMVLQERLYAPVQIACASNTPISREERICSEQGELTFGKAFPTVEEGDILISFNCHVLGWRSGHAALVVDTKQGLSLEARVLGTDTALISLENWLRNPSVAVLRVRDKSREDRRAVADYAREHLVGIPYDLLAWKGKEREEDAVEEVASRVVPEGTHCAHLVWMAYNAFGIDLDSDGGWIVTPRDIYDCDQLEIVQVYGMATESLRE